MTPSHEDLLGKLRELEELARKATPGPYEVETRCPTVYMSGDRVIDIGLRIPSGRVYCGSEKKIHNIDMTPREAMAHLFAKCEPAAILSLIASVRQALEPLALTQDDPKNAYYNLGGAIFDIEQQTARGDKRNCDAVSLRTLKRVETQLGAAYAALAPAERRDEK